MAKVITNTVNKTNHSLREEVYSSRALSRIRVENI